MKRGYGPIDSWTQKITSAQMENIKKNFASAKPMNEKPLAIPTGGSADAPDGASVANTSRNIAVTAINVIPYYTGYSRIDNAIMDALKGKSQELKDNVYDIIWSDLLRADIYGIGESESGSSEQV